MARPLYTPKSDAPEQHLKHELQTQFLSPPSTFSPEWLNKLQARWDGQSAHYAELCRLPPPQTRTITRFTRHGLEGKVAAYRQVTLSASASGDTAKNSTSLLRKPANRADFVRGAAGFFPFAPGGLDGVDTIQAYEDQVRLEEGRENSRPIQKSNGLARVINFGVGGGLLEVPPGFARGMKLAEKGPGEAQADAEDVEQTLNATGEAGPGSSALDHHGDSTAESGNGPSIVQDDEEEYADLDDLLPVEFPSLAPRGKLLPATTKGPGKKWAHVVDINKAIPNFQELVPDMARTWPFELDTFQKEAVYHLESGDSVFVAAHTSAGKTVVAEYAIALAAKHMTKAIYTSPIKALSNQKFRDFKNIFDDVGILTGDVQINPEASCLIMTTEILRSMLYRGADLIRDVEFVIFDEVHYVNDLERGVVWEEVIIMLPDHVTLILLSATVPNTYEFASWVGRTKKKDIYVISTPKRPVPLEHYLWAGKEMHKIVDSEKRFLQSGWRAANDILSGLDKIKEQKAIEAHTAAREGQAPGQRGGGRGQPARGPSTQRGGAQQRGRGPAPNRGQGNIARTGRGGGRTTAAQDRNIWVHLVQYLRKENLLPACIFVFSKKRCEENADSLSNQDFCTATEKSAIHMVVERSIARLKPEDRVLPQIRRLREMLGRGVAVHHGGLLPIVKEIVEILFAKTLVKVLFATETFAMGLNLPTRTVVFSGYRKHDGREFRNLLPGEYTQMAGRAGRRGLDTVGTVIIVTPGKTEAPSAAELTQMITGPATKLRSQFRLHYNMILNLMRVEALKIEEMIKRSFSENATQALLPQHQEQVALSQATLDKIKREPCDTCDIDAEICHEAAMQFERITKELYIGLLSSPVGRRLWTAKRLIVFKKDAIRTVGMLLEDGVRGGPDRGLKVLEISHIDAKRSTPDLLPYLPCVRMMFSALPETASQVKWRIAQVLLDDVECVTQTVVKVSWPSQSDEAQRQFVEEEFVNLYSSWASTAWDEQDWSKVHELHLRDLLVKRSHAARVFENSQCLLCPQFLKHYGMQHDEWLIQENIQSLKMLMSDQNLSLLPDYQQRTAVLKDLGFIDEQSRVQLKGKVACEIHSADELVLTELILENVLASFEPEEIVALLSSFVFQEKTDSEPQLSGNLERGKEAIIAVSERVNHYQILHQVILSSDDANDFVSRQRFGLVEVVFEWARGMSFNRITDLTDVMEGTIVRVITRLDETCREVMSAARLIGDPSLYGKMDKAREMIRRDVVFTASLYM
ncbi:uncharacterized protein Z519_12149 [Cladophialophora bantiana CBS 173.52]|uniref:Uncharacterized protein n=1 Tax=Cladophialophora bantiana (strain ATCC 10958 / CBS 173.52 / CDC B-1940 / NIH 8579) TaxID=1442370 RepID=A0A0D2EAS5_CLAB1|nr:uncharacterized protein Z519_12149 [Cladophialophora bantiana CBS 173.52]KIW87246.1 hypothetical protein Z519_12149 [Cladophialophora bantiana CBS 173.52]